MWISSPICYVIIILMLAMSGISWFWDRTVFWVELSLALLAAVAVVVGDYIFKEHVRTALRSSEKVLSGSQYLTLQQFIMQVAVA